MSKLKLTKNELKRQKDTLKRFRRYLPTLQLKKQQLQVEIAKIYHQIEELDAAITSFFEKISAWIAVFAEDVSLRDLITLKEVFTAEGNIAGVDIPVFERIEFSRKEYDLLTTPLWVDFGIDAVAEMITMKERRRILNKQLALIKEELRITTQRVNLFEKVKIPQARENIRKIQIWLGDLQTAAVVVGKIAKVKIQNKEGILA